MDSITGMNNQGTIRIGTEDMTYVGFSGSELTGVTRVELIAQQQQPILMAQRLLIMFQVSRI